MHFLALKCRVHSQSKTRNKLVYGFLTNLNGLYVICYYFLHSSCQLCGDIGYSMIVVKYFIVKLWNLKQWFIVIFQYSMLFYVTTVAFMVFGHCGIMRTLIFIVWHVTLSCVLLLHKSGIKYGVIPWSVSYYESIFFLGGYLMASFL